MTAHRAEEASAIDWSGVADPETTVVVYMGLASAAAVRDGLVAAGRDPATPAAVLARGTRPDARSSVGRLDELPALAATAGAGPALLIIGETVATFDRRGATPSTPLSITRNKPHDLSARTEETARSKARWW